MLQTGFTTSLQHDSFNIPQHHPPIARAQCLGGADQQQIFVFVVHQSSVVLLAQVLFVCQLKNPAAVEGRHRSVDRNAQSHSARQRDCTPMFTKNGAAPIISLTAVLIAKAVI